MTDYTEPTDAELLTALAAADQRIAELANTDTEEPNR
ncbi:hypothetical protein BN978_02525 [Mycolicibacterium mageritense DSM 44476 = CIP 104973]|nr:hypothetical protein BN978_02525 [Mycolicibacterium mageritense DSM 44476 = CIP 104973]